MIFSEFIMKFDQMTNFTKLHFSCRKGDFELIKILLHEIIENDSKDLLFKINKIKKKQILFY